MEDQLISFDMAKLAKEKGFNQTTELIYLEDGSLSELTLDDFNENGLLDDYFSAPTQSLLQKFLRDIYKIRVFVDQGAAGNFIFNMYTYPVPNTVGRWKRFNNIQSYSSYEEALEAGLFQALKLIK